MRYVAIAVVLVVVAVMVARLFRSKPRLPQAQTSAPRSAKPLLRQFGNLRAEDFERHPVWVQCHIVDYDEPWYDDTDEETFRPWSKTTPVDPKEAMFLVKATFRLADGTELSGFVTPQNSEEDEGKPDLGLLQPQLFLPSGKRVGFWCGILSPPEDEVSGLYAALGKTQQEVFPVSFAANEGLAKGVVSGSVPGFCSSGDGDEVKVHR